MVLYFAQSFFFKIVPKPFVFIYKMTPRFMEKPQQRAARAHGCGQEVLVIDD